MFNNKPIFIVIVLMALLFTACGQTTTDEAVAASSTTVVNPAAVNDPASDHEEADNAGTDNTTDNTVTADGDSQEATDEASSEVIRPEGWRDETHSKSADPNYAVVFPEDKVNTLTITIAPEEWQAMLDDMTATYGELGSGGNRGPGQGGPGGGFGERPGPPPGEGEAAGGPGVGEPGERPALPPGEGEAAGRPGGFGQGGQGVGDFTTENPIWVAGDIEFDGDVWTDVGVRFKGNSSLMNAWSSGSVELPFKLDFDEFEDENPAIDNQRFYGFKQLSLSNNTNDPTFMRDVVTSDILADAGIASAETGFYNLIVEYGEGPVNFGLYTMIEVIDDTVIDRVYGDDDGNIYEGDGASVSLAEGTYDGISASFQKENNEDEADWSDIEALYTVLHSDLRLSDPAAWKAELEAIFDADTFLHWLAINTVIENWDTYGAATHNFYLYNNPETGQLTWIPWDHNEALQEGRRSNMTLAMDGIGDEWPLISFLLADDGYYQTYVGYVDETINTVFQADVMTAKYEEIANLIEPYAEAKIGAEAFGQGVQALIEYTVDRVATAEDFLEQSVQ